MFPRSSAAAARRDDRRALERCDLPSFQVAPADGENGRNALCRSPEPQRRCGSRRDRLLTLRWLWRSPRDRRFPRFRGQDADIRLNVESSNARIRRKASSFSNAEGSSNAPSRGSGDAADWPRIGNVCHAKRSPSCALNRSRATPGEGIRARLHLFSDVALALPHP